MSTDDSAETRLFRFLTARGGHAEAVQLKGDASTRSFFRVPWNGGTAVVMVYGRPGEASEEAYDKMTAFFRAHGFPVANLLDRDPRSGVLALEDLGDLSLRLRMESLSPAARLDALREALSLVARLQGEGTAALEPGVPAFHTRFDTAIFLRELEFFHTHYVERMHPVRPAPAGVAALRDWYREVSQALAALSDVLCHRDFHIDNLMVRGGKLFMIDFQDARIGPAAYDVASLLKDRDIHTFINDAGAKVLLEHFLALTGRSSEEFAAQYDLAVVQRCLKAVGTFAYQTGLGKAHYKAYIPPTLDRVRRVLAEGRRLPTGSEAAARLLSSA